MEWVVELPRFARIVICAIFGLAITMLVSPLVDDIYLTRFFNRDTVMIPALISTAVGVIVYVIGWRVFVGYSGERPQYTRALFVYLVFGMFITVFTVALFILGMNRR